MNVESAICQELALVLAIPLADLESDRPLVDYGLDSVRTMEIVAALEDLFDIEIENHQIAQLDTLAHLVSYVQETQKEAKG